MILDHIFLQWPREKSITRFPLPFQAVIHPREMMNVEYPKRVDWAEERGDRSWQNKLQGGQRGLLREMEKQFCEFKVLCLPGVVSSDIFTALGAIPRGEQVQALQQSEALAALVVY